MTASSQGGGHDQGNGPAGRGRGRAGGGEPVGPRAGSHPGRGRPPRAAAAAGAPPGNRGAAALALGPAGLPAAAAAILGPAHRRRCPRPGRLQPARHRRAAMAACVHGRAAAGDRTGLGHDHRQRAGRRTGQRPRLAGQRGRPRRGGRPRRAASLDRGGWPAGTGRRRAGAGRDACVRRLHDRAPPAQPVARGDPGHRRLHRARLAPLPGLRRDAVRAAAGAPAPGRLGRAGLPGPGQHRGRDAAVEPGCAGRRHRPDQPAALPRTGGQRRRGGRPPRRAGDRHDDRRRAADPGRCGHRQHDPAISAGSPLARGPLAAAGLAAGGLAAAMRRAAASRSRPRRRART